MEHIQVGSVATFTKTVTEADVVLYAGVTGDFNPVHVDDVAASQSSFGRRIAHGMLTAGFISTVIAMKLPGPGTIYLSQSLKFTAPVFIGDTITARVTVQEILPKRRVRLATHCFKADGTGCLEGEALVLAPAHDPPA